MARKYDFSGWATKNDLMCSDGRTIRRDAFKDNDGCTVPLVWNHQHNGPTNVLGHALLQNRPEGVYTYCTFNDTKDAVHAKTLVSHGDIVALSIYANRLQQRGPDVIHGSIKEVSLVLAGANPGALIDEVIEHGDSEGETAIIYTGERLFLEHADSDEEDTTWGDVYDSMSDDQQAAIDAVVALYIADREGAIDPDDIDEIADDDPEIREAFDSMDEEQRKIAYALIAVAVDDYENGENDGEDGGDDENMSHSDWEEEEEEENMRIDEIYDSMTDEQQDAIDAVVAMYIADAEGGLEHADESDFFMHADDGLTLDDVFDSMTDEQYDAAMDIINEAVNSYEDGEVDDILDAAEDGDNDTEAYDEGDYEMAHNIFESGDDYMGNVLSHSDEERIFSMAQNQYGSLRKAIQQFSEETGNELVIQHDDDDTPSYGITNLNYMFPDAQLTTPYPIFIKRPTEWVAKFMGGTKHTPFSRLKSVYADITADEARAKGYVTAARKAEEVFSLLNRTTDPTTVYKKNKLDRDNVIDVKNFKVAEFMKSEMKIMLDEEVARAALIGDGRSPGADKINESCIRPIWTDDDLFTIKYRMEIPADATEDVIAKTIIRGAVKSRKNYRGSGSPIFFTTEDYLTDMLLMEDLNGHAIYEDEAKLARALRCREIVVVPQIENRTRTVTTLGGSETRTLYGIIVNPADYTFGADNGGATNMFDDFDIDFNQYIYLLETRCSGSLLTPYSAIALEGVTASA